MLLFYMRLSNCLKNNAKNMRKHYCSIFTNMVLSVYPGELRLLHKNRRRSSKKEEKYNRRTHGAAVWRPVVIFPRHFYARK